MQSTFCWFVYAGFEQLMSKIEVAGCYSSYFLWQMCGMDGLKTQFLIAVWYNYLFRSKLYKLFCLSLDEQLLWSVTILGVVLNLIASPT